MTKPSTANQASTEAQSNRQICSPEHPMPKGAPGRWAHTNVEEVGEQMNGWPGGDIQGYRCKD